MWTTCVAPLGDRGTGTQNVKRTGEPRGPCLGGAVPREPQERRAGGGCAGPGRCLLGPAPERQFLSCGSFLLSCWKSSRPRCREAKLSVAFPLQRAGCWPDGHVCPPSAEVLAAWSWRHAGLWMGVTIGGAVRALCFRSAEDTVRGHGPSERGHCQNVCRPLSVRARPRPVRAGCHP